MNTTRTLLFLWTPWSLALSVAFLIGVAVLSWFAWRRSGYSLSQGGLELIRLAIAVVVAVLFNQPEWVEEYRRFWEESFERLDVLLEQMKRKEKGHGREDQRPR